MWHSLREPCTGQRASLRAFFWPHPLHLQLGYTCAPSRCPGAGSLVGIRLPWTLAWLCPNFVPTDPPHEHARRRRAGHGGCGAAGGWDQGHIMGQCSGEPARKSRFPGSSVALAQPPNPRVQERGTLSNMECSRPHPSPLSALAQPQEKSGSCRLGPGLPLFLCVACFLVVLPAC